jgi:hypothetical protein
MRMKSAVACLALFLALAALPSPVWAATPQREALIGAWRLVSLEEPGPDGILKEADSTGLLVFTRDGRMSVQVMYRDPQPQAAAGPVRYAQGGYEASFGRYEMDERANTFSYRVEGALVRSLVGKYLPRTFALSRGRLVITSSNPDEHWKVTWAKEPAGKDAP